MVRLPLLKVRLFLIRIRNDILRKHGVIPEKPPSPTPFIQEALEKALEQAHKNRLENKDLDELDALEDEEDETFLEEYKQATPSPLFSHFPNQFDKTAKAS